MLKSTPAAQLEQELLSLCRPNASMDSTFMRWYVGVRYDVDDSQIDLVDGTHDGGIDAIVYPSSVPRRIVFVQTYYAAPSKLKVIPKKKLGDFIELSYIFDPNDSSQFEDWLATTRTDLHDKYRRAYRDIQTGSAKPEWLFLTSARSNTTSKGLAARAKRRGLRFVVADRADVLRAFSLYIEGAAPPEKPLRFSFRGSPLRYSEDGCAIAIYAACLENLIDYVREDGPHYRLFSRNVRLVLNKSKINAGIIDTARKAPEEFLLCHNGITVICSASSVDGQDVVEMAEPSVVNGAQTLMTLAANNVKTSALVPVRVIEIGDYSENANLVRHIVLRSNTQNAISPSDLVACDHEQVALERYFRDLGRIYIRRRGQEALDRAGPRGGRKVRAIQLATILASCDGGVSIVDAAKSRNALFEGRTYERLFVDQKPPEVLGKVLVHEFLEKGRKRIKNKTTRSKSRYAWRNVLRATWSQVAAERGLKSKLVKNPIVLGLDSSRHSEKLLLLAAEMYEYAWSLYANERKRDEEVGPGQFFFGRENTATRTTEAIRRRYGKRLARLLWSILD